MILNIPRRNDILFFTDSAWDHHQIMPVAVEMSDDCCAGKQIELERLVERAEQRRVLVIVLAINAAMFLLEFSVGAIAGSAALMADSVDMMGDALVYGVSIYALERSHRWKAGVAMAKGVFILGFGCAVIADIIIKLQSGLPPSSTPMVVMGILALVANLICLRLLWRFRSLDVNMASTFECSRNDVISNLGVLAAAVLVTLTHSAWPDLLAGAIIATTFLRSALRVIRASWRELILNKPDKLRSSK